MKMSVIDCGDEVQVRWSKGGKQIAFLSASKDGLIEFDGGRTAVAIENVGTRNQQILIGNLVIRPDIL